MCNANWEVTLARLVLNQISRECVVGRRGGGEMVVFFREDSMVAQSDRAQLGVGGGGGLETKEKGGLFFYFIFNIMYSLI